MSSSTRADHIGGAQQTMKLEGDAVHKLAVGTLLAWAAAGPT